MNRSLLMIPFLAIATSLGCSSSTSHCEDGGCEEEDLDESYGAISNAGPAPTGYAASYPIILAQGVNSSSSQWNFYKVADTLRKDGHVVYEAEVEPFNTPLVRARSLQKVVDQALLTYDKVNIVAHSAGGLDARTLISELGYGDRVASLTTISSPHRGSYVGDVMSDLIKKGKMSSVVDKIAEIYGRTFTSDELANNTNLREAFLEMSEQYSPTFNDRHPDDSRVYYQSWAAVSARLGIGNDKDREVCDADYEGRPVDFKLDHEKSDLMEIQLRATSLIVGHGFGWQSGFQPNDGMVEVKSAKWGHFRGCLRADHYDIIGQPKHDEPNKRTKFDHLRFYRTLAFELQSKGF